MFRGSSYHSLDEKGRVIVPARFRDAIKASGTNGIMATKSDRAVFAYPFDQWSKVEAKVLSKTETSEKMRRFRRVFIGGAVECPCDKQGRILIPPFLRDYAGLEKEIVLVGQITYFEIWSKDRYANEVAQLEEDLAKEDFSNETAQLGL